MKKILVMNLPGLVLKCGSRWYNRTKKGGATLKYYPYPWMMGYLTALLKREGFDACLKDAVALEWTPGEARDFVRAYAPDAIVCEPTWASIAEDRAFLDSLDKGITKIAVGNYATNFPAECLQKSGVAHVAVGEYEFSILDFLKSGGKAIPKNFVNASKPSFELPDLVELDRFPFPERDDTPIGRYNEPSCYGVNLVMVSSRGCRLKCDFCNVECIYGRHAYRTRDPKSVVDEIVELQSKYAFDEIYFDDDNMVSRKRHIDAICKEIVARGVKAKWLCMGDGLVDDETLGLLAKAGCVTYKYGLEHLDEEVLKAIPKALKPARLLDIIAKCRELGMRSYVNLIVGLPKSTFEKDLRMMEAVVKASPDLIQISIATPYPGTAFFAKAKANGWLVSEDPSHYDATGGSAVSYPDYPAEKIVEMFHLGWNMWYRHALLRKPSTMAFFLRSEIRRNGLLPTMAKSAGYMAKAVFGMGGAK